MQDNIALKILHTIKNKMDTQKCMVWLYTFFNSFLVPESPERAKHKLLIWREHLIIDRILWSALLMSLVDTIGQSLMSENEQIMLGSQSIEASLIKIVLSVPP